MAANSKLIDELYDKIIEKNIVLINEDTEGDKAVTIKDEIHKAFGIVYKERNFENSDEKFCVLAHEYGHCESDTTHKLCSRLQLIEQYENRANRAAVYEFLPVEKIKDAFKRNYFDYWEIADYLDLPEAFVKMAIDIYTVEGKLKEYRCVEWLE